MEWIKKNPHQLALAVCSAGLIGASALVLLNSQSLPQKFSNVQLNVPPRDNVPPLDLQPLQDISKTFEKPAQWTASDETIAPLFISKRYIVSDGKVIPPERGDVMSRYGPIPRKWFIDHGLNPFDPTITMQDLDKDSFLNEDEFYFGQTNPHDAKSHPPYHTKLFLKQYIRVPFRLKFQAYNEGGKSTFQINTLDLRQPTEFLAVGEKISRTPYKIEKFEKKFVMNPRTGVEEDVSELTVVNTETNEPVILVLNRTTDSPESFALFTYEWPDPDQEIRVKKFQDFVLRPDIQQRYKLLDIKETQAVIQLPSGEKYTVTPPPQPGR